MSSIHIKLIVAGAAVTIAVAVLAVAGAREGWVYYLPVDQFVGDSSYHDKRVRLHGLVAPEDLEVSTGLLVAKFDLMGDTQRLRVDYGGVVPDSFQADREVVVEGALDESGVFRADTLLTKCASKYQSEGGQSPHVDPREPELTE